MAHIIVNPSLSDAIGYKQFFYPPKFAVVIVILEPANSTQTDNSAKGIVAKSQKPPLKPPVFKRNVCIYKLIYRQSFITTGN